MDGLQKYICYNRDVHFNYKIQQTIESLIEK